MPLYFFLKNLHLVPIHENECNFLEFILDQ